MGPSTERIIVDLDAPELQSSDPVVSISHLLKDLFERTPKAISVETDGGLSQTLRLNMTPEECERLVRSLLTPQLIRGRIVGATRSLIIEIDEPYSPPVSATSLIPLTVYLSNEANHAEVEAAIEQLLDRADLQIESRDEPVIGSWFRRMQVGAKKIAQSPGGREAMLTAVHAVDARVTLYQDAQTTALLLQNLGPVIQSLQPTKDAVLRVGALLVVKIDWTVYIHQLTAAQQALLDHQPDLAMRPQEIIEALQMSPGSKEEVSYAKPEARPRDYPY
jgi:hypothetical protein